MPGIWAEASVLLSKLYYLLTAKLEMPYLTKHSLLNVSKSYKFKGVITCFACIFQVPLELHLPVKTNQHAIKGIACSKMSTHQMPDLKPYFYFCSDFPGYRRQIPFFLSIKHCFCFLLFSLRNKKNTFTLFSSLFYLRPFSCQWHYSGM